MKLNINVPGKVCALSILALLVVAGCGGNGSSETTTSDASGGSAVSSSVTGGIDANTVAQKIREPLYGGKYPEMSGSSIDIEANEATKTVKLKGTVNTEAQLKMMDEVGKKASAGSDIKVLNELKVVSPTKKP
ncbi:hypothetical protein IAD21_01755 [Abditibacteriota bacterium]|nr:hypothetical protein IAD21_01755 [Abditibacteriota bacterium]